MGAEALIAWIATAGVGFSLLGVFFGRGGMRQLQRSRRRLRPQLVLSHIAFAVGGLGTWIAYLVSGDLVLAWVALGLLLLVTLLGSVSFYIWQRRRLGVLRATDSSWDLPRRALASEDIPAEQHFPASVVLLHGVFAVGTIALVLHVALAASNEAEALSSARPGLAVPGDPGYEPVPAGPRDRAGPVPRPRGVRVTREGAKATVAFRPATPRTVIEQLDRRRARRGLASRTVADEEAGRQRVRLRLHPRARYVTVASLGDNRTRSRAVLVRLR